MSWLFSQALVEEYSGDTCSDGGQSAPLSVMPTPHPFWLKDKMTKSFLPFQYGQTCAVLTADRGEDLLTSYLAASRARTLARQEKELGSQEHEADFGRSFSESSERCGQLSLLSKTALCSPSAGFPPSSKTLPRWGMMRNGVCWERETLGHRTKETESGFWPTPKKRDWKGAGCKNRHSMDLATAVKTWPTPRK